MLEGRRLWPSNAPSRSTGSFWEPGKPLIWRFQRAPVVKGRASGVHYKFFRGVLGGGRVSAPQMFGCLFLYFRKLFCLRRRQVEHNAVTMKAKLFGREPDPVLTDA